MANFNNKNNLKKLFDIKSITLSGIIGAFYVVLSLATFTFASSPIQFRIAEGLTILPLIFPQSIMGLTLGCLIANLITGCTIFDIFFGSVITFFACVFTFFVGKLIKGKWVKFIVGGIFPVLLNAFLLPLIWYFTNGELKYLYILQVLFLVISQSLSVYLVGAIIYIIAIKYGDKMFKK